MSARYTYTAKSGDQTKTGKTINELAGKIGLKVHDIKNGHNYTGGKWPFQYKDWTFSRERRTEFIINVSQNKGREWINSGQMVKSDIAKELKCDPALITKFANAERNLSPAKYKRLKKLFV